MKTLILATDECSAGRLKASKAADRVWAFGQRLVQGPLPSRKAQDAFFGPALPGHEPHWHLNVGGLGRPSLGIARPSLVEACQEYERIEIWADADPNSYLVLAQLAEVLRSGPDLLRRTSLAFPSRYIGELSAREFESARPPLQPLTPETSELISRAWRAHQSSTPEAWRELLEEDLTEIPGLRTTALRILAELPAATNGLSASEAKLLAFVRAYGANHDAVLGGHVSLRPRPTLDYWEAGQRIVGLSRCDPPIILGVGEDSFSLELHDDRARFDAYAARSWSLSTIGQRIADGHEDLADHVPVDRWVGNTHLTPDRLWRWDAANESLVEPK